jgi:hypothetical protein
VSERRDDLRDVQAMSDVETVVYEAVASCAVESISPRVPDIVRMTGLGEDVVRENLDDLVAHGWLLARRDRYVLGPHDWGLEY